MVENAVEILKSKYNIHKVDLGIVCGSGLGDALPDLKNKTIVSYEELGLPKSKVKGHSGNFIFGLYNNKVVVLISRIHYYESGKIENVRLPFQILAKLGLKKIILLTSSGGLNKSYNVGDLVLIKDHINMTGINPLVGIDNLSFTNMTDCYNRQWRTEIKQLANEQSLELKEGVFVQMSGPSYETNAEVEMLRKFGGDTVSMSTAFDCIICNYFEMKVVGFSVVVNVFNDTNENLSHQEVLDNAQEASRKLKRLLTQMLCII